MKTYSDYLSPNVGFPASNRPSIEANHIDGPMLRFRDGQVHWLTLWERFLFWVGKTDAEKLERKHRPAMLRQLGISE